MMTVCKPVKAFLTSKDAMGVFEMASSCNGCAFCSYFREVTAC